MEGSGLPLVKSIETKGLEGQKLHHLNIGDLIYILKPTDPPPIVLKTMSSYKETMQDFLPEIGKFYQVIKILFANDGETIVAYDLKDVKPRLVGNKIHIPKNLTDKILSFLAPHPKIITKTSLEKGCVALIEEK